MEMINDHKPLDTKLFFLIKLMVLVTKPSQGQLMGDNLRSENFVPRYL